MTDHETFLLLAAKHISEPLSTEEQSALEAHLAMCPTCRSTAVAMRRDDIRLRAEVGVATVSPRVRRRVLDEAAGRRGIDPRIVLGLAAALVIGAIGVPLMAGARLPSAPSPPVTSPSTVPAPTPSPSPSVALSSPSAEATGLPPSPSVSGPFVAGAYIYGDTPPRRGTVAAHFEGAAVGEWSRTFPATGNVDSFGGPVTCLVISGQDAWLAGPATTATDGSTDRAALIYVHDGGLEGSGDMAMTWMTEPGQTLATVTAWCQDRYIPAPPFELSTGDVVVREGPS